MGSLHLYSHTSINLGILTVDLLHYGGKDHKFLSSYSIDG